LQKRGKYIAATSIFALTWLATIAAGLSILLNYDNKPGAVGAVPAQWPDSPINRPVDSDTLVMAAHPRCPCTRASIDELARVMARVQGKLAAYVLLVRPIGKQADWDDTDLRRSASAIPGVTVLTDIDGVEARRFGAETSGHTLLYDKDGHLVFSGGITESRGHAGDNAGESAIIALVNKQTKDRTGSFVFGCPLHDGKSNKKTLCRR
jgi:hypothetical protein